MSIKVMTAIYDSDLKKSIKHVALAYADHADDEGANIFPSVSYIAWKTGYSKRQVQRITQNLVEMQVLVKVGIGPYYTNKYRLRTDKLPTRKPFVHEEGGG